MCRGIRILRPPYAVGVTDSDIRAAAVAYVRTVGGFRLPAPQYEDAFNQAVDAVTDATRELLANLAVAAAGPAQ
jgi:hypothetical protein